MDKLSNIHSKALQDAIKANEEKAEIEAKLKEQA